MEKENLRRMPSYNALKDQTMAMLYQQALQQLGLQGQPMMGQPQQQTGAPQTGQRGMVPPIPERASPGSAQDIQNQLRTLTQQNLSGIQTQGRGGGGNR